MPNKQEDMELYRKNWDNIMTLLNHPKYRHVHKWYSTEGMWCYLSYCGQRTRIDYSSQLHYVEKLLQRQ